MKTKITEEGLINLGFIKHLSMIQDSFSLVFHDICDDDPFIPDRKYYYHKELSLSVCNDKGKGEYYVFIREGNTEKRCDDDIITITRNMLYIEDLTKLIEVINL